MSLTACTRASRTERPPAHAKHLASVGAVVLLLVEQPFWLSNGLRMMRSCQSFVDVLFV